MAGTHPGDSNDQAGPKDSHLNPTLFSACLRDASPEPSKRVLGRKEGNRWAKCDIDAS
jgi:hypothetical protein